MGESGFIWRKGVWVGVIVSTWVYVKKGCVGARDSGVCGCMWSAWGL